MRKVGPIILTLVGIVLFAVGVGQAVGGVASTVDSVGTSWVTGRASTQTLTAGGYVVYERSMQRTLDPSDITVTGPDGAVPVSSTTSSTVTLGDSTWVGVAGFTAPVDGDYTITIEGEGKEVVLGPSLARTLSSAFGWFAMAGFGALLAVAGVVWLIVALLTGRKPTPAVGASPTGAGGWYPDPEDPSQLRWWDGRQWTDQRAPRQ